MSKTDVWLEHIRHLRSAIAGIKSARTKCARVGPTPENLERIRALEAMQKTLEDELPKLRRELHEAMKPAARA